MSHSTTSKLVSFRQVAFRPDFAKTVIGYGPTPASEGLRNLCQTARTVIGIMRQPGIHERGLRSKIWTADHFPGMVRKSLVLETAYVESALGELEQFLYNPLPLFERGAGSVHYLLHKLGVEPSLRGADSENHGQVIDWMSSARSDFERCLVEVRESKTLLDSEIEEEKQDLLNFEKGCDDMKAEWTAIRRKVLYDPTAGVMKAAARWARSLLETSTKSERTTSEGARDSDEEGVELTAFSADMTRSSAGELLPSSVVPPITISPFANDDY